MKIVEEAAEVIQEVAQMKTKPKGWEEVKLNKELADLKCQLDLYYEKYLIDDKNYSVQYKIKWDKYIKK